MRRTCGEILVVCILLLACGTLMKRELDSRKDKKRQIEFESGTMSLRKAGTKEWVVQHCSSDLSGETKEYSC
jgi:hypothetical protein